MIEFHECEVEGDGMAMEPPGTNNVEKSLNNLEIGAEKVRVRDREEEKR